MDEEVQFTDEQWEAVATAAEAFADVLSSVRLELNGLLHSNWAGACSEGEGTIENLRSLLTGESGSFAQALNNEYDYLTSVAAQCRMSKAILNSVDFGESERMGR